MAEERPDGAPWDEVVVGLDRMAPPDPVLGPRWFPGARLNFAENLLRHDDDRDAIVFWNERGRQRRADATASCGGEVARGGGGARARMGVGVGDRVAGFLPNLPEAIVAMLAAASLGAIWSSCSPDFGVNGVLDRFGQIQPRVLFCADGYRYAGKEIDSLARVREMRRADSGDRAGRGGPVPRRAARRVVRCRSAVRWNDSCSTRIAGPDARASSACRSITRSTSCTRRAPRVCPSAWCTAPAARCSSI